MAELTTNLLPVDGLLPEEIELLMRSARTQEIESEPTKVAALPPRR